MGCAVRDALCAKGTRDATGRSARRRLARLYDCAKTLFSSVRKGGKRAPFIGTEEKVKQAQSSRDRSRASSSTQAVEEVSLARLPEAQFLMGGARTSRSECAGCRIRKAADHSINWPLLLDLARHHGVRPLLCRTISTVCTDLIPLRTCSIPCDKSHRHARC